MFNFKSEKMALVLNLLTPIPMVKSQNMFSKLQPFLSDSISNRGPYRALVFNVSRWNLQRIKTVLMNNLTLIISNLKLKNKILKALNIGYENLKKHFLFLLDDVIREGQM